MKVILPNKSWHAYRAVLKNVGEQRLANDLSTLPFLRELGLVSVENVTLTEIGALYFKEAFIHEDEVTATALLQKALLHYNAAVAICQLLDGVRQASRAKAETILRNQGLADGLTPRTLGSLLVLLDVAGLIEYSKRTGSITIKVHLSQANEVPSSVFISPMSRFANHMWLKRTLEECSGYIYWIDKHFLSAALEFIWEIADGERIHEVRIISLKLESNSNKRSLKMYKDLKSELTNKGIRLEWRFIDSKLIRGTHDRWIIGAKSASNVPDVGTILSGNHSEITKSMSHDQLKTVFEEYWGQAEEIVLETARPES